MSTTNKEKFLKNKFEHQQPERLTLFSICCPCLRPKKLKCRASDIALMMYGKDEPHEYVVEKLIIKRVPLRFFGVEQDFLEYEQNNNKTKTTKEIQIETTEYKEELLCEVEDKHQVMVHKEDNVDENDIKEVTVSENSLKVNCNTPKEEFEGFTEAKSGEELMIRTITSNIQDEMIMETDHRIAKMSPDLEKTINVLKGVKPRPVSQGIPMPIKNQRQRLSTRNIEYEGILTKDNYNYIPCKNDNPLQGIHYSLDRTTFTPAIEEESKSIITDLNVINQNLLKESNDNTKTSLMVEAATTNYEDATINAEQFDDVDVEDNEEIDVVTTPTILNLPSETQKNTISDFTASEMTNFYEEKNHEFGERNYSVYQNTTNEVKIKHRSPTKLKKQNLKWKIIINNDRSKDVLLPTSSSNFQLEYKRDKTRKRNFFGSTGGGSY